MLWVQTHFLANGKNGHEIFIRTDGSMSANNNTPVDGAEHTLWRAMATLSAVEWDIAVEWFWMLENDLISLPHFLTFQQQKLHFHFDQIHEEYHEQPK